MMKSLAIFVSAAILTGYVANAGEPADGKSQAEVIQAVGEKDWAALQPRLASLNADIAAKGFRAVPGVNGKLLTGYEYAEFYDWDLYFENLYLAHYGISDYCFTNLKVFLDRQKPDGFVARSFGPYNWGRNHQFKPFLAQTALLGSRQCNDFKWMEENYYARLGKYLERWMQQDKDGNGLPVWDSADASGMDNQIRRAGQPGSFFCEGVDLACYLVREFRAMAIIAGELGKAAEQTAFTAKADALAKRINDICWDEKDGFYYDRNEKTGKPILLKSVAGFIPLWAGVVTPERARRLVKEHLLNENEFWLKYPVSCYAKTEPDYYQGRRKTECNWCGTTWIPTNYMIFHGLRRYGFNAEAQELATRTFRMVLHENPTTREFYSGDTGNGNGLGPFWGWSSLAYVMPLEAAADCDPTDLDTPIRPLLRQLNVPFTATKTTHAKPVIVRPEIAVPPVNLATKEPLPIFEQTRPLLPAPVYDANPGYVAMYWKAWELAFRNFHNPQPESGFVSPFIDAAFSEHIYLWDTCFMTLFCNVAHPLVPGIGSLDNFYAKQHPDGEICREINRSTGKDFAKWIHRNGKSLYSTWGFNEAGNGPIVYRGRETPKVPPKLTLDALNHPIFAWAEMEHYRIAGDKARLQRVYPVLVKHFAALQEYLRQGNGLYMTDWASMDNSPRNPFLKGGGCGVDISCEMALVAQEMSAMASLLDLKQDAARFDREARDIRNAINRLMWDPDKNFYFDLTIDDRRAPIKTIAAYWTLLAGVASKEQANALVTELTNPKTFGRMHRVPTLAADQPGYDPKGGYWRGAVWAPTTTMVIRGLEKYGHAELAHSIARQDLDITWQVFQKTGTVWENYAPDSVSQGVPAKPDFVGWTGIIPILYFLEYGVGLKPVVGENELVWDLRGEKRVGCERYRFNRHVVDLLAVPTDKNWQISVRSDSPFTLKVKAGGRETSHQIRQGEQQLLVPVKTGK